MACNLYRHFDEDGVLLYVGISLSAVTRLNEHMRTARWGDRIRRVDIEVHETRDAALLAEKIAILDECPAFNIQGRLRKRKKIGRLSCCSVNRRPSKSPAEREERARLAADRRKTRDVERAREYRRKRGSVSREDWLRSTISAARPWESMGISRSTWYREQRKAAAAQ